MNKEEAYDSQIAPLIAKIIDACKANKIAMLATFSIPTEDDDSLECTTALLKDDFQPPKKYVAALNLICCGGTKANKPLMLTTRDKDGNVVNMESIL